jgi:hypothetical protein
MITGELKSQVDKIWDAFFAKYDLYSQLYQKHFKKTFAGRPTKKYLQIMKRIHRTESAPYQEIESYLQLGFLIKH